MEKENGLIGIWSAIYDQRVSWSSDIVFLSQLLIQSEQSGHKCFAITDQQARRGECVCTQRPGRELVWRDVYQ
ncbi:MAG: hypothetical protein JSV42_06065 [Chloroflexota bacterium]|nr:MAG: hypothetical protein JSV42_06065 [Chloroflexota bacterium]